MSTTECVQKSLDCSAGVHGYREHVVGQSSLGWDIIDVVCPDCGARVLKREVVSNPDNEHLADNAQSRPGDES